MGEIARQEVRDFTQRLQRELDRVLARDSGKSPTVLASELRVISRRLDFNLSEAEVKKYATALASGEHIHVKFDGKIKGL